MGLIFFRPEVRSNERRKAAIRTKLFQDLKKRYLAEGRPVEEANAMALAKVRATRMA